MNLKSSESPPTPPSCTNNGKETSGLKEYEKWKKAKKAALDKFILLNP
jgi:hypothetical protein